MYPEVHRGLQRQPTSLWNTKIRNRHTVVYGFNENISLVQYSLVYKIHINKTQDDPYLYERPEIF